MTCLLCGGDVSSPPRFTDLILLHQTSDLTCSPCRLSFEKIAEPHCPSCYRSGSSEVCSDCLYWQEQGCQINHQALYRYNEAMKAYFSLYKFFGDYVLTQLFAKEIKKALKAYKDYVLVPVPVSPATLAERGFNQVEGLLDMAGLTYQQVLVKGEGVKQSEKSRADRLASRPNYQLKAGVPLPEKIILVDDIYTTGATLASIVGLLRENGVREVKTFSLAR